MKNDDLKKYILENLIFNNKIITARIRSDYNNLKIKDDIIKKTSFLPEDSTTTQRIYHIINNIYYIKTCKNCDKPVKFLTFNRGYREYCNSCGMGIKGDIEKSIRSKKIYEKKLIEKIISDYSNLNIMNKNDTREYLNNIELKKTHNWFDKKILKNTKLLASILYYTNFLNINFDKIEKLGDFGFNERLYCFLNNINEIPICNVCKKNKVSFINFEKGYQKTCSSQCGKNIAIKSRTKTTENKINKKLEEIGCVLLDNFNGYRSKSRVKCNICGKSFLFNFPHGSWIRNTLCPYCYSNTSKPEKDITEFLENNGIENIVPNTKEIIPPYELDVYLPNYNLAIEYNGLYWHSEISGNKDKNYHLNKTNLCENNGIQLLHIFENEWLNKQEIVKSVILSKMGIFNERIYARKCEINEIDNKTKNEFLENNHLQGKDNSSVRLGLFYNKTLVAIMTFGRRKITGGDVKTEILRYCNKLNTQIIGGAGKLFKYFINNYENKVVTYVDKRYGTGDFYKNMGFVFSHISKPNYWYLEPGIYDLINRVNFQKHKLKNKLENYNSNMSEWENMIFNNYDRIWDCGNIIYKYNIER